MVKQFVIQLLITHLIFKQRFHTLGLASLFKILLWINEFLIRPDTSNIEIKLHINKKKRETMEKET
uniref:Ubiquinol-cytochrome c reductase complex 7.8 kDa protein n=1 Tax=Rhizophora mucronata TaxID=61149 RepID=A0A2P2K2K1_RHIMU